MKKLKQLSLLQTKEKLGDGIKGPKIKHKASKKFDVGDNKLEYYLNKGVTFSNI